MRVSKTLAVTALVIGAIGAFAAAPSFGAYHIASSSGGSISGFQKTTNQFTFKVGTLKCLSASLSGFQSTETVSILALHPEYSSCTLAGQFVTVNTGGCDTEFFPPATPTLTAPVSFECGVWSIVIKDTVGLGCVVELPSQGLRPSARFENESGKVLLSFEVSLISYKWTAGCPNAGGKAGSATNGTYTGSVLLSGSSAISVT